MSESDYPAVRDVVDALAAALQALREAPRYLTFSGNGEPTLHPRFREIVDGVNRVRDRLAPNARTAILSNSSRVMDAGVREALGRLDERIMKLDAGTEAGFARYNRPVAGLKLGAIVEGLRALPDVTLQALLTGGTAGNLEDAELEAWLANVARIRPRLVQLYTLDRDAPDRYLLPATREQIAALAARLADTGVPAEVF